MSEPGMGKAETPENLRWLGNAVLTLVLGGVAIYCAVRSNKIASNSNAIASDAKVASERATATAEEALRLSWEDYPRVRMTLAGEVDELGGGRLRIPLCAHNDSPGEARRVLVTIGTRNLRADQSRVGGGGSFFAGYHMVQEGPVPVLRYSEPKSMVLEGQLQSRHMGTIELVWRVDWEYGPRDQPRHRSAYGDLLLVEGSSYAFLSEIAPTGDAWCVECGQVKFPRHAWAVVTKADTRGDQLQFRAADADRATIVLAWVPKELVKGFRGYVCDQGECPAREGRIAVGTGKLAYMREQPGTAGAPVRRLGHGQAVLVERWVGDWCYVDVPNAHVARRGWVAARLVEWEQPVDPFTTRTPTGEWGIVKEAVWTDRPTAPATP